jgi:hypothetical protein
MGRVSPLPVLRGGGFACQLHPPFVPPPAFSQNRSVSLRLQKNNDHTQS